MKISSTRHMTEDEVAQNMQKLKEALMKAKNDGVKAEPYVKSSSGATQEEIAEKRQRISEMLNKNKQVAEPLLPAPRYDDIYWDAIETLDREVNGE